MKKTRSSAPSSPSEDRVDLVQVLSNNSNTAEDEIISLISSRFKLDLPYTRINSSTMIVVNPNKPLEFMNDESAKEYADQWYKDTSGIKSNLQPHIYELAAKVYLHMRRSAEDQSVIFSGITGSGKTASQGHLLQQLLLLSTHTKKEAKLANQIQNAQTVLEAFGNAKTTQNINASRFGKYLELQFNEKGRIVGSKILTYCFDKSRVTGMPHDERTYHVFYYLLAGVTSEERSLFQLQDPHNYNYLSQSKSYNIPDVDDSIQMEDLRAALKILGFKSKTVAQIWQILSAILLLGNIEFINPGKNSKDEAATIKNHHILDMVAQALGVPAFKLEQTLTYKTKYIGKELCTVFLDAGSAKEQRDALARTLYSILFTWIVEHINTTLIQSDEPPNFIGLLDQPGYQNFAKNSFEQFCFNFATEEIQNYVLKQLFDDSCGVNLELSQDGINLPKIQIMDNNGCVELLRGDIESSKSSKLGGMIGVLDSECSNLQSGKNNIDDGTLLSTLQGTFSHHPSYVSNPPTSKFSSKYGAFGINHFAGQVIYSVDNFIDKNLDNFSPDFVNIFQNTNNTFIKKLFTGPALTIENHPKSNKTVVAAQLPTKPMRAPSMKKSKKNISKSNVDNNDEEKNADDTITSKKKQASSLHLTTVTTQLFSTLNQLIETLNETKMWNVFQIRPNDSNDSDTFDTKRVKSQIRGLLIPDITVKKKIEYTAWYTFKDFLSRYDSIIQTLNLESTRSDRQKVEAFATISGWGEENLIMGNNYVFVTEIVWKGLEDSLRAAEKEERAKAKQIKDNDSLASGDRGTNITNAAATSSMDRLLPRGVATSYTASEAGYDEQSYAESEDDYQNSKQEEEGSVWGSEWGKSEGKNKPKEVEELPATRTRVWWVRFVWFCTWWIPSFLLVYIGKMKRPDVRMAWREKVTLCFLILFLSLAIIFFMVGFGLLICPGRDKVYSKEDVALHQGDNDFWVYTGGVVYDLSDFHQQTHSIPALPAGPKEMEPFGGKDITFTIPIPLNQPESCLTFVKTDDITVDVANETDRIGTFQHISGTQNPYKDTHLTDPKWYWNSFLPRMKSMIKADIVWDPKVITSEAVSGGRRWAIIDDKVYDLGNYFFTATKNSQNNNDPTRGPPNYRYLQANVEDLFTDRAGQDITKDFYGGVAKGAITQDMLIATKQCLDSVFYVGRVDFRSSFRCVITDYLLLSYACLIGAVIIVKFLAALQLGSKRKPEEHDKFVICQVPCYTEGEDSIKRTMDSLTALTYDDKRKLLFFIADGMIVGSGNDRPTPRIVLDILGVDPKMDPEPLAFKSVGEGSAQLNYGKVYSGLYENEGHVVPYIVVVKVGKPSEKSRPGNRGKRDSQIVLMGFLNKVHFDLEMSPLELEIYYQMKNVIGINPSFYEYILMVDADTEVMPDSLNRMISCMLNDGRIIGICGETTLVNEEGSWTTMIQVYEYYISHHLSKAFESLFGSVTCLPGCFCMYRIRTPLKGTALIISNLVIEEYSENHVDTLHKKNLLHLGEDRYLTTLMMKHFPQYKMTFTPDALCKTAAPDRWAILLSQRRRWINSTIHNLMELMFLPELCGFCCFSMRFVVFIDLLGTLVLPSTVIYLIYLVWAVVTKRQKVPEIALIMLAAVYGLQAIIFILKRQWQHVGWMIIYLIAYPLFSFFIPIYSFWHFDDFSWGNTRVVLGEKGKKIITSDDDETFDEGMIPKKKWSEYEQELWEVATAESHESGLSKQSGASAYSHRSKGSRMYETGSNYGGSNYGGSNYGGSNYGGSNYGGSQVGGDYYRDTVITSNDRARSRSPAPYASENRMSTISTVYSTSDNPSDDEILLEIRTILNSANLMNITKKQESSTDTHRSWL
nr:6220_t:CDS:2 [Entrophospora candida]